MADIIVVQRKIFGKNSFSNVVDYNFNQIVPANSTKPVVPAATVESFFQDYNTLFYDIPPSGSNSTHLELVNKSSEYLGISLLDMQAEIENLRSENVALKNQIYTLTHPTS